MNTEAKILNKIKANNSNSTLKNYTAQLSGIQPWHARILQHMQINKCDKSLNK